MTGWKRLCRVGLLAIPILLGGKPLAAQSSDEPWPAFPDKINRWKAAKSPQQFSNKTIFDYMNGAGEIYLAYGLQNLTVQEYAHPSESPIVVEIYEMPSPNDAYGVSTFDTEGEILALDGHDIIYGAGLLRFHKGAFFVRMLAEQESPESRQALMSLSRGLLGKIEGDASLPEMLGWLPGENLKQAAVRYFHTKTTLNSHYFLSTENLLGLSMDTDAVLARYRMPDDQARILVVRYPSRHQAAAAAKAFAEGYLDLDGYDGKPAVKAEKDQFVIVQTDENVLLLGFEASRKESIQSIFTEIIRRRSQ